jgi:hypothetical protein
MVQKTMSETAIVKACLDTLQAYKVFSWRNNSGALKTERGGFIRFGAKGSPDIIAIYGGQFIGIEVKASKGKQSKSQKDFQKAVEKSGGFYWLVYSGEELELKIKLLKCL